MKLGCHVLKNKSYADSIEEKKKLFASFGLQFAAAQIFVIGPKNTKDTLNEDEGRQLKDCCGVDLIIHGNYLDHILGTKAQLARHLLRRELEICSQIDARGVVIHIPPRPQQDIADAINEFDEKCAILLEIGTYKEKKGAINYADAAQLKKLFALIKRRVGLVVDTAHLWASGIPISTRADMKKWLAAIDPNIFSTVYFHLNDQTWGFGEGHDKHTVLTKGTIWGEYGPNGVKKISDSGIAVVAEWAEQHGAIIIFEEHGDEELTPNLIIFSKLV